MQPGELFLTTLKDWNHTFMRSSMRTIFHQAKIKGLSMPQIGALMHVSKGAGGVSAIGDELGITLAAASQMIDRLVQQGLILRSEDPLDRRAKHIELTEKGRQVLKDAFEARQDWLDRLAASLSPAELEQVSAALQILIARVRQLEEASSYEHN